MLVLADTFSGADRAGQFSVFDLIGGNTHVAISFDKKKIEFFLPKISLHLRFFVFNTCASLNKFLVCLIGVVFTICPYLFSAEIKFPIILLEEL